MTQLLDRCAVVLKRWMKRFDDYAERYPMRVTVLCTLTAFSILFITHCLNHR